MWFMKLKEYFEKFRTPIAELARKADITPQTIYNLMKGVNISADSIFKIEDATNGIVKGKEMWKEYIKKK